MKTLHVNQLLDIVLESGFTKQFYPVRIEDIDAQYIYMGMPMKYGAIVRVQAGQEIQCIFRDVTKYYGFSTHVIKVIKKPIPMLMADKPNELLAVRQKRDYVRLQVVLQLKYRILDENNEEENQESKTKFYDGQTINISAGGILFTTEEHLQRHQDIEVKLYLPNRPCFNCKAKIVRVVDRSSDKKETFLSAIQYEHVTDAERDRLFKYIFEKERELIKYGFKL